MAIEGGFLMMSSPPRARSSFRAQTRHPEAAGVDELHLGHVHGHVSEAFSETLRQAGPQGRRGGHVDLPRDPDGHRVAIPGDNRRRRALRHGPLYRGPGCRVAPPRRAGRPRDITEWSAPDIAERGAPGRPAVGQAGALSTAMAALRPLTADDAAARMGGRPAQVQTGTGVRGENRRSHICSGRHSPWKMCPPVSPMPRLDVGRTEHLPVHDACRSRRERSGPPRRWRRRRSSSRRPSQSPDGQPVGHVLGEHAHGVAAGRGDRRVVGGVEVQLAPRRRRLAPPAGFEGRPGCRLCRWRS